LGGEIAREKTMAVLVEAISVIVRRDSIDRRFIGGWNAFLKIIPNATLCYEDELARVGFMEPGGVGDFINRLEQSGLVFLENRKAVDIVVCDQFEGPTTACDWIEFGKLPINGDNKVAAAWLFEGRRIMPGLHFNSRSFGLAVPAGWRYEDSLSHNGQHISETEAIKNLEFLRSENGVEVYWNKITNKEVYVGRKIDGAPFAPRKRLS
jgi:hypothetical protein